MIKKFVTIRNVGSFESCSARGDVELRRLTLLSAENGRGKTTISDVLRSLKTGDPEYLNGRARLGAAADPEVQILVDGHRIDFSDGSWTEPLPEIEIFDSTFICRNVFSGNVIDHDHKKNLYQVIVGERGVSLAQKVTELDGKSREASRKVSDAENELRALLPRGTSVDPFLDLSPTAEVTNQLSEKQEELEKAKRSNEIRDRKSVV